MDLIDFNVCFFFFAVPVSNNLSASFCKINVVSSVITSIKLYCLYLMVVARSFINMERLQVVTAISGKHPRPPSAIF